jgi:hypothetical protein
MFCAPGPIFGGAEGVQSLFHVLRAQTHFRRFRGRRVPFSRFALSEPFLVVLRASSIVLMFCEPKLVFDRTEGVGSRYRRYRGHKFSFSCFARPESFSAVPRAAGLVFMFCAPGLIFGGTEGVGPRFHVLRVRTRFQRCPVRRVPFSCFAHSDSFSAV